MHTHIYKIYYYYYYYYYYLERIRSWSRGRTWSPVDTVESTSRRLRRSYYSWIVQNIGHPAAPEHPLDNPLTLRTSTLCTCQPTSGRTAPSGPVLLFPVPDSWAPAYPRNSIPLLKQRSWVNTAHSDTATGIKQLFSPEPASLFSRKGPNPTTMKAATFILTFRSHGMVSVKISFWQV